MSMAKEVVTLDVSGETREQLHARARLELDTYYKKLPYRYEMSVQPHVRSGVDGRVLMWEGSVTATEVKE